MKSKIILTLFIVLSGVFLFYWFQYRPSKIRNHCDWKAKSKVGWEVELYGNVRAMRYQNVYSVCLHENGI